MDSIKYDYQDNDTTLDINDAHDFESDQTLRPQKLTDYVGQSEIKEMLNIYIQTALKRNEPLDHVLLYGPPGLGKTTLASIIANEMGTNFKIVSAPSLHRTGDLAALLVSLEPGDVLFIDEIHRLPRVLEETLYSAMEDFRVDIMIGKDATAMAKNIDLAPFTLVGATTRYGDISSPLRDRFGIVHGLNYYSVDDLKKIVNRTSSIFNFEITDEAATEIARRSRGTPRIVNRLFRRVRDFNQYINESSKLIELDITKLALAKQKVDEDGLDELDRKYLNTIIDRYKGGPVGLKALAASIGEEVATLEDICEPYLLQEGYVIRSTRGRVVTDKAYKHLGIPNPSDGVE